jgi:hypothetical protein
MYGRNKARTGNEIKKLTLNHLEKKYNEKFIIHDTIGQDIKTVPTKDYNYALTVYPENNEKYFTLVYISHWNGKIWDNYFWHTVKEEYSSIIKSLANSVFSENKIIINPTDKIYPAELRHGSTLNDLLILKDGFISTMEIYIKPNSLNETEFRKRVYELAEIMVAYKIRTYCYIRNVISIDSYNRINEVTINQMLDEDNLFYNYENHVIIGKKFDIEVD